MTQPQLVVDHCDRLLDVARFRDYTPNGLQVEGERPIARLVTGVTASAALIEAAIECDADALLVHHGWFWRNEDPCLTGIKGRRVRRLVKAGMSLIAYHLPLDAHPELGNNATLAHRLAIQDAQSVDGSDGLLWLGRLAEPTAIEEVARSFEVQLGRSVLVVGRGPDAVQRIGWCTGGGQGHLEEAAALGVDVFLSGELSEQTTHSARETGIWYLAAGHHATERFGVQALGEHLAGRFGLEHRFIEIDNPA